MREPKRPTVLIVDEVPAIIRLLELELGIQGFDAVGCGVGVDAFRAVEELHPNVIVLELILPGISGLEMLREFKKRYDIPVLILTTLDSEADRAEAFDLGADDYVQKPFDPLELGRRVASLIHHDPLERRSFKSGDLSVDLTRQIARRGATVLSLTTNEWATLLALGTRAGETLTLTELGAMVGGEHTAMQTTVLWPIILRLRKSLEEDQEHPRIIIGTAEDGVRLGVKLLVENQR
jgi:DNA-binding response OmpR family regulator